MPGKSIITLIFTLFVLNLQGRSPGSPEDSVGVFEFSHVSAWYHHGYLLPHHRSMAFYTIDNINGAEVFASRKLDINQTRRPTSIGAGYYYSNLGNKDVYGRIHGMYVSVAADFCRSRLPFYFQQTTSFGIGYNTERFDINENYANRAIGSHLNAFVQVSVDIRADINDRLSILAGPSVVHTSNGNIKHPNYGLNLVNARFGMSYRIDPEKEVVGTIRNYDRGFYNNRFQLLTSGGIRNLSRKIPEYYFVGSLMADYSYRFNRFQAMGAGLDFVLDPTEGRATYVTEVRVENIVPWHVGVHLTWERIWGDFSIVIQPGYKVITLSKQYFMQYNRAAVRYRVHDNLFISCAIKAHELRADFIEFGVGYSFVTGILKK